MKSKNSQKPIEGVHVFVKGKAVHVISDKSGGFQLPNYTRNPLVLLTHVAFDSLVIRFSELKNSSILKMSPRTYSLPAVSISEQKLEEVFHSRYHYVFDYEFLEDKIVLLTFNRSLKKDAEITVCDANQQILFERGIGAEPEKFIKDYKGNLYLQTSKAIFVLSLAGDSVEMKKIDKKEYAFRLNHCVDSVSNHVLFNDFKSYIPRMNYYALNTIDSNYFLLKSHVNDVVNKMYRWEYYELSLEQKREAREMAEKIPNMDKKDVGAMFTGFHKSIYYEPVYAPLFVKNDTVLVFDHSSELIFKFNQFQVIDSVSIRYAKNEAKAKWKNKLIMDESEEEFYGLYLKSGYYVLKNIDVNSGNPTFSYRIEKRFAEKLKIDNGYVYYLYKQPSSQEKPFLYRELIAGN